MTEPALTPRAARRSDLSTLCAMLADDVLGQSREGQSDPPDPRYVAAFEAIAADPNQNLVVFERDGHMAGMLQITFIPGLSHLGGWRGNIEAVRVMRSLRGQGLGHAMMQHAIDMCRAKGCYLVQLTSNAERTEAQRFYRALGFVPSHVGYKLTLPRP